ncbi:hypothetical protein HK096_007766 [Nowakowskiella sp. JEL0078]|nr:hypothetical protein HK096_007766 [Nowakowskiella sp. JEL0078]
MKFLQALVVTLGYSQVVQATAFSMSYSKWLIAFVVTSQLPTGNSELGKRSLFLFLISAFFFSHLIPRKIIVADYSTACSNVSPPNISSMYSLMALVDLHDESSFSNCSSFYSRLISVINSTISIQSVILNVPSTFTTPSADIELLKTLINITKIPIFQLDTLSFSQLSQKSRLTAGEFNANGNRLNLSVVLVATISTDSSTSPLMNGTLTSVVIALILLIPFFLEIYKRLNRKRDETQLELEQERIELERLQSSGAVVYIGELERLKVGNIIDLGWEVIDNDTLEKSHEIKIAQETVQSEVKGVKYLITQRIFQINWNILKTHPKPSFPSKTNATQISYTTNASCTICLESFKTTDLYRKLHCSHIFHVECIDYWLLKRSRFCPLCRIDVIRGIHEDEVLETANMNTGSVNLES